MTRHTLLITLALCFSINYSIQLHAADDCKNGGGDDISAWETGSDSGDEDGGIVAWANAAASPSEYTAALTQATDTTNQLSFFLHHQHKECMRLQERIQTLPSLIETISSASSNNQAAASGLSQLQRSSWGPAISQWQSALAIALTNIEGLHKVLRTLELPAVRTTLHHHPRPTHSSKRKL
ncbi:MAG TPA: hypothetical protein VGT41_03895 [Candidatus Babeliales bacterium]|nr:hypothetical protein [Candidatus Babeliales bacterium]